MDRRRRRKVWRRFSARLLSVKSPVAEIDRVGRIAEIEDKDVVARPPSIRCVIAAPADDVGDSRIAFPPAFASRLEPREHPFALRLPGCRRRRCAPPQGCSGCHVPDLVRGLGVGPQHVNLAILDRQCVAVTNAHHLGAARYPVRYRQME